MKSAILMLYLLGFAGLASILTPAINTARFEYAGCRYFGAHVNNGEPVWICPTGRLHK